MKYLSEEYWKYFFKTTIDPVNPQEEKIIHDGLAFEELVHDILELLFEDEEIYWKGTLTTHDGSKDFIGTKKDGSQIWAECKNHGKGISLSTVAPTLVMAEISSVKEILIFSYSSINKDTKEKLLLYAEKRRKRLFYYDDENLEDLILYFYPRLNKKYFPALPSNSFRGANIPPYVFSYMLPQSLYYSCREFKVRSFSVKTHEIICICIGISNNNCKANLKCSLTFSEINDLDFLELIDARIKPYAQYKWEQIVEVAPGEAVCHNIHFKISRYKKHLKLPSISVKYLNASFDKKIISFSPLECNGLFNTPLIGQNYLQKLKEIEDCVINKSTMSMAILYGKSGVGKSRLLQESSAIFTKYQYPMLYFSLDSITDDEISVIREIIYYIYNLTEDLVIESLKEYQDQELQSIFGSDQFEVLNLLQDLNKESGNHKYTLEKYKILVFYKLLSQRIAIVIDNLQFASSVLSRFILDFLKYANISTSGSQCIFILSYNTDYYCNSDVRNVRLFAEEHRSTGKLNITISEVMGMKENNLASAYVQQLIHTESDNESFYFDSIIKKADYNPKHIENILEFLYQKQVINIADDSFIISDAYKFYGLVDKLPNSFEETFAKRYRLFLKKEHCNEEKVKYVLSAVHFLGAIATSDIEVLSLPAKEVSLLERYGFLEENTEHEISFEHDLYEKYFTTEYKLETYFIDYVFQNQCEQKYQFNMWQRILINLKDQNNKDSAWMLISSAYNDYYEEVPFKLQKYYFDEVTSYLCICNTAKNEFNCFMKIATKICLDAKNEQGSAYSVKLFQKIYNSISDNTIDFMEKHESYRIFINEYCENLLQNGEKDVLNIYKKRLDFYEKKEQKDYEMIAKLYNRIYVFYKHRNKEVNVHKYLSESQKLCKKYQYTGLIVENYFDEGNYYLFDNSRKDHLINCWSSGCSIFKENRNSLENLTLNALKKEIQLNLLLNDYEKTEMLLEEAMDYVAMGKYNEQSLFFKTSLYFLKGMYGLMSNRLNTSDIHDAIDMAAKLYAMKNSEKPYLISFMYAKLSYVEKQYETMICHYSNAIEKINKKHYYHKVIKNIILDDCTYKLAMLCCQNELPKFSGAHNTKIYALYDICSKMTLPEIDAYLETFHTISNISTADLKDGYIF